MATRLKLAGCCDCGGPSCSLQCRSRSRIECCGTADGAIPAHAGGTQVAPSCSVTSDDVEWSGSITPIGPGDTAGTTKYRFIGAARRVSDNFPLAIVWGAVSSGGTLDVAWGSHVILFNIIYGLGNPYDCTGTICVQEYTGSEASWSAAGTCTGAIASKPVCAGGAETRTTVDLQVRVTGSNLTPENNYTVEVQFGRRAIGSLGGFDYFASGYTSLSPSLGDVPPGSSDGLAVKTSDWLDVPNEEGFQTVILGCSISLIV